MTDLDVVRMFWPDSRLSIFEIISIASFLQQGHRVQVYGYEPLTLPPGAEWLNAEGILPHSLMLAFRSGPGKQAYASFLDAFRYKVLLEKGGIWSELDSVCLKPLHSLPVPCVALSEYQPFTCGILRFAPGHPLVMALHDEGVRAEQGL